MKKLLLIIMLMIPMAGCSGTLSLDGLASTGASTGAAVIGTALGGPLVGTVVGVGAGVVTDLITDPADPTSNLPPEEKVEVLKNQQIWMTIESLGIWALVLGAFFLFVFPLIIGYLMPNSRERKLERMVLKEPPK